MSSELPEIGLWLDGIRRGETNALAALFDHYRLRLKKMVQLRIDPLLAGRIDPSDVLQESYLDAARQISAYVQQPKVIFYIWLRGLVWERLLNIQRSHLASQRRAIGREITLPVESSVLLANQLLASGTSPSNAFLKAELQKRVQIAIKAL